MLSLANLLFLLYSADYGCQRLRRFGCCSEECRILARTAFNSVTGHVLWFESMLLTTFLPYCWSRFQDVPYTFWDPVFEIPGCFFSKNVFQQISLDGVMCHRVHQGNHFQEHLLQSICILQHSPIYV